MSSESVSQEEEGLAMVDRDDIVEVFKNGRRAVSSGEPSLDGSIDEERAALSDSDIANIARTQTIAKQAKGPSSDALEEECLAEATAKAKAEWQDVLGSGQLFKRTVQYGSGPRPRDGCRVVVNVVDTLNGIDSHEQLEFILGFSYVIDAWELVIKLMKVGDTVELRTSPRFAYGDNGLPPNIPGDQSQEYRLELLSSEDARVADLDTPALLDLLVDLKERGNFYFNRAEYEKAIFVYRRAVESTKRQPSEAAGDGEEGQHVDDEIRPLLSALHSNLAVCYCKLEDWRAVLEATAESLRMHDANPKALYRRAVALLELGEAEEAIGCLQQAKKIDPNDRAVTRELENAYNLGRVRREHEKKMYKKMLSGVGDRLGRGGKADRPGGILGGPARIALLAFCLATLALFFHFLFQV